MNICRFCGHSLLRDLVDYELWNCDKCGACFDSSGDCVSASLRRDYVSVDTSDSLAVSKVMCAALKHSFPRLDPYPIKAGGEVSFTALARKWVISLYGLDVGEQAYRAEVAFFKRTFPAFVYVSGDNPQDILAQIHLFLQQGADALREAIG